jgi:hypothetical protein
MSRIEEYVILFLDVVCDVEFGSVQDKHLSFFERSGEAGTVAGVGRVSRIEKYAMLFFDGVWDAKFGSVQDEHLFLVDVLDDDSRNGR